MLELELLKLFLQIAGWFCILVGCLFIFSSAVGFIKMPDFFTKVHAAGISDSFGCPLALVGIAILCGSAIMALKIILLILFMLLTGPTMTYLLASGAIKTGLRPITRTIRESDE